MYHGGVDKVQHMLPKGKRSAVFRQQLAVLNVHIKEIVHHGKGLLCGNNHCLRIGVDKILNVGRVVRLHVLYDQVVRLPSLQDICNVVQPLMGKVNINRVHDSHFLIQDHIGIVGHTVWNHILALKQVHLVIVDPHVTDGISNRRHK